MNTPNTPAPPGLGPDRKVPEPVRVPGSGEGTDGALPSPRAALLASVRTATDRRQREQALQQQQQQQQQQQLQEQLQYQYQYDLPYHHGSYARTGPQGAPYGHAQTPPPATARGADAMSWYGRPATPRSELGATNTNTGQLSNGFGSAGAGSSGGGGSPGRVYAALHAKQQELLAQSVMLSQQQQRLQMAMNSAAASYGLPRYGMDTLVSPMGRMDINGSPYSGGAGGGGAAASAFAPPPPVFADFPRPSSPSLPVRPSSSASFRSPLFGPAGSASAGPSGPGSASSTASSGHGSSGSFVRGHRKSSSLSSSGVGVIGSGTPRRGARGPASGGTSSGGRPAGEYEIPFRQPRGPPPLDELRASPQLNFSSARRGTGLAA